MSDVEEIQPEQQESKFRDRSRSPIKRERSRSRSPRRNDRNDRRNRENPPFRGGKRVILRNIPYELRWQELKDMFRKEIGDVSYVEVLETPSGKSKGVAVVEFKDSKHAEKAIEEFHQKKLNDRAIIVREEREKDRQEFMNSQNNRMQRGNHGDGPGSFRGESGSGVLSQLGIEGPISCNVFVANLDYKVTWWKLKDVFKLAGNVIKAEIKEDKNGKSRGMGVVQFEHPMEAVQAVAMFNNQQLFDRKMIVRVDKAPEPERPRLPSGLKSIGMGLGSGGTPLTNFNSLGSSGMGGGLGGAGLLGMGGLGGSGGLGLLGAGAGDLGLGSLSGGLGGGLSGLGGLGGSGSLSGSGMGMGDLGLGSKVGGLGDNFGSGMGGSGFNGNSSLAGLGGLNSLGSGLGSLGNGDRMGLDRLGMGDSIGRDRMGGDMMGSLDNFRMSGRDRDSYGGGGNSYGGGRDRDMGGMREERSRGGSTRPDNCTVIVKNIPYTTNWQNLKDHFRDAGDVKFAEVVMENGRSTGVGYVRFANYEDARRAIDQKHRSRLEKRNIDVSLHRN